MKIYFASDHAGFELKEKLIIFVRDLGYEAVDKGASALNLDDDYPDFIALAASEVSKDKEAKGIILGGSGEGEAMVANRFPNVRAVAWYGESMDIIKLSREHNDANVLSIGARFVDEENAKEAVKLWLETSFSGDARHVRRIKKIERIAYNR
ncbi:MAG: RpiB/LacA/LacB family sugar-phosphate isomerase [Patescibacteria group bacterium]